MPGFANPQTTSGRCEATVGLYGTRTGSDGHWQKVWLKAGSVGLRRWGDGRTQEVRLGEEASGSRKSGSPERPRGDVEAEARGSLSSLHSEKRCLSSSSGDHCENWAVSAEVPSSV